MHDKQIVDPEFFIRDLDWIGQLPLGLKRIFFSHYRKTLAKEKDPRKLIEKRIVFELHGTFEPGMAGSNAFMNFRSSFYDRINNNNDKELVKEALAALVASRRHSYLTRVMAAFACADTGTSDAIESIRELLKISKKNANERSLLNLAVEALTKRMTPHELINSGKCESWGPRRTEQ